MDKFNINMYWESRYLNGGNSGAGSYNEEAEHKAKLINAFISQLNIETIQEYGVGDGNNLKLYRGFTHFNGYDISETAIKMCKKNFTDEKYFFTTSKDEINTSADMALSLDVIFHQVNDDDYYDYLHMLFNDKHKYVVIYATCDENNVAAAAHMKHRHFVNDVESMVCFSNYRLHSYYAGYDKRKIMVLFEKY